MRRSLRARRLGLALAAAALLVATEDTARTQQTHAGEYAPADITYGLTLYGDNCVSCHGPDGAAIDGINFRLGIRAAASDPELMEIIRSGIEDTAMPPGDYTNAELTALVAYLRNIGDFDTSTVTIGDAGRGETIYRGRGDCARCHRIGREGSRVAPDLTEIGAVRSAGWLADSLTDPTRAMLPINRTIRAVAADGTRYTGRRLNEDTYTVQIIDENERLVSLVKADLREYTIVTASAMPSYAETLTDLERADVLAFLLTLKGID